MPDAPDRDENGRFLNANRIARLGGRPATSISSQLRRLAEPDKIAAFLLSVIDDPKAPLGQRLQAADMVLNRLEGKAIGRSMTVKLGAASALPIGFAELPADARGRVLDDLRHRALQGCFPAPDEDTDE